MGYGSSNNMKTSSSSTSKKKKQSMSMKLKEHSSHHSPKHMRMMRMLIKKGMSFSQAHRKAQKEIGK